MEEIKKVLEKGEKGSVFVAGKFEDVKEFSDHLKKVSEKLDKCRQGDEDCYTSKRVKILRKPLLNQLVGGVKAGEYDKRLDDEERKYVINVSEKPEVSQQEYDQLVNILSEPFSQQLYEKVSKEFEKLNDVVKAEYGLEVDKSQMFGSVELLYNDMFGTADLISKEKYGLPIISNKSKGVDEFYLLENGDKLTYEGEKSLVFKNESVNGFKDFVKKGFWVKDILSQQKTGNEKRYAMERDYSFR